MKKQEFEWSATEHAIRRTRKRRAKAKSADSALRFLDRAWERGRNQGKLGQFEESYLHSRVREEDSQVRIYDGYCLIFGSNRSAITMYQLPDWFGRRTKIHTTCKEDNIVARGGNLARYYDMTTQEWVR